MKHFFAYSPDTGEILCSGALSEHDDLVTFASEWPDPVGYTNEDVHPNTHYYDVAAGSIKQRKDPVAICSAASLSAVVGEHVAISDIPAVTTVIWPDGYHSAETGEISFDVPHIGEFTFRFVHPHYLEKELTFVVNAP